MGLAVEGHHGLENFKINTKQQPLWRGTFGKVVAARRTRDGKRTTHAVKLMESKVAAEDEEQLACWAQEWHIWHTLCPHPNILQIHEVYYGMDETCPKVVMVSDLADRDLPAFTTYYSQVELVDTQLAEKQAKGGTENAASNFAPRRRMTKKRPGDHQLQMVAWC